MRMTEARGGEVKTKNSVERITFYFTDTFIGWQLKVAELMK